MRAASTQFRRFVASLMLVAMTSFGLHSAVLAGVHGHGPAHMDCSAGHAHGHVSAESAPGGDLHKAGHGHHHGPLADSPDEPAGPASAGLDGSCCTGGCPVAATAPAPESAPLRLGKLVRPAPEARSPAATFLDGLKRPPRSLGTA